MRRKVGIALMVGAAGYSAWRLYRGTVYIRGNPPKMGVDAALKAEWEIFSTSGFLPAVAVAGLGATLVWG